MRTFICKHCHKAFQTNSPLQEWCSAIQCQRARKRNPKNITLAPNTNVACLKETQELLTKAQEENVILRKLVKKYKTAYYQVQSAYQFAKEIGDV